MKNIVTRSISGIVYVALIIGSIILGASYFMALATVFAILATFEFHALTRRLYNANKNQSTFLIADIAATVAIVALSSRGLGFLFGSVVLLCAYLTIRIVMAIYQRDGNPLVTAATSVLGVLYVGLPLGIASALNYSCQSNPSLRYLMLIVFIMIWLNDTGAYCVGCLIGRHRLFERLSPKKSWEGFWGGLAFSTAAGIGCYYLCPGTVGIGVWAGLGLTVSVFATWGDLFESLIKRAAAVKDSGHIMPGHGGMLDRIDSLLLVAPATYLYVLAVGLL